MNRVQSIVWRSAVALCGVAMLAGVAAAQQDATPAPMPERQGQGPGGQRGQGNPEQRMQMLKQQLSLTDDQTAQVKGIFADERTKLMALRDDTATPQADKRGKMQAIRKEGEDKLDAILTPDQKTKYAAMRAQMRDQARERRGAPGAPGAGTQPPPAPPQQ
jgi:protein CpxP